MLLLERAPEPDTVVDRDVGGMRLHGYTARQSGGVLELELYWQALAKPAAGLVPRITLSMLDERDSPDAVDVTGSPLDDFLPMEAWTPGQVVVDRRRFAVSHNARYLLSVTLVGDGVNDAVLTLGRGGID